MKKFTALLLISMAIGYSLSAACTITATNHAFHVRMKVIDTTYTVETAELTAATAVCGNSANICCTLAKIKPIISTQLTNAKNALKNFGDKVAAIGGAWTKVASLANSTAIGTATAAATLEGASTADASGATGAQFKAFGAYTVQQYQDDFAAFKTAVPDCFTQYSNMIKKIACDACTNIAAPAAGDRWHTDATGFMLKKTAINAWAEGCAKAWNFVWKFGWFVQTVAYLNSKKATGYTYTAPAAANVYFNQASTNIEAVNTALTNCGANPTAAACTDANKLTLVQVFAQIYGDSTTPVGRGDVTIAGTTTFYSNGRLLAIGTAPIVTNDETKGFDAVAATATLSPDTDVTLVAADLAAWSSGYVAPSSSSSSSSSTTTSSSKNAKVLFGTVLSFLAVALLN